MRLLSLLALMLCVSLAARVALADPSDKATPLEQRAEKDWKQKQELASSGSLHLAAAAAAISDFHSQLLAVDFGVAQAPINPVVTPPATPPVTPPVTPPIAPGPLPDLTQLLPNLANLSQLIPPGLLPPGVLPSDVTPGAVNPIVTKLFDMFFKFLGVLSKMQLGTATAEDLATLETIQSELTAGFGMLPAEAQQQLGSAFAKIMQILQTIHDELAAQVGATAPPTAPTNATVPTTPTAPTNMTLTLRQKHSVLKKKLEPVLLRDSVFTISQDRPRRDDPRDRSPRRDDDWRQDRRCRGRGGCYFPGRGGCYQPGRRPRRGDPWCWDHRRGRPNNRDDLFDLMQATQPTTPTTPATPPAVNPANPTAPANPVSPTNPLTPFLPPGLENLLPTLMKPNPIAAKLFELVFKFLGVLSNMQQGNATAADLATLESIQTDLTGGFAALPADVQTTLQSAFDKLIAGLESIKTALTTMIGGTAPVTPTQPTTPTTPANATEPTAPVTPPAQAIMMNSQLQNVNLHHLMRSTLQLTHLMLGSRVALSDRPVRLSVRPSHPNIVHFYA